MSINLLAFSKGYWGSLSKPCTSMTALHTCVCACCLLGPTTYQMSVFTYSTPCVLGYFHMLSDCSVRLKEAGLKFNAFAARTATYFLLSLHKLSILHVMKQASSHRLGGVYGAKVSAMHKRQAKLLVHSRDSSCQFIFWAHTCVALEAPRAGRIAAFFSSYPLWGHLHVGLLAMKFAKLSPHSGSPQNDAASR